MCASHMARTHRREALLPTTTIPRDTQVGIEAAEVCEPRAWLPSGIPSLRMHHERLFSMCIPFESPLPGPAYSGQSLALLDFQIYLRQS